MNGHQLMKVFLRCALSRRGISTTALRASAASDALTKSGDALTLRQQDVASLIGSREIVGYGINGHPTYIDMSEFPCPAVRFKEDDAAISALRKKEKDDWKNLTLEEKKTLYRASFCQTIAEIEAPTGQWKAITAEVFMMITVTMGIFILFELTGANTWPKTCTKEWQEAQIDYMLLQRRNPVHGIASWYDYEKNKFKPGTV